MHLDRTVIRVQGDGWAGDGSSITQVQNVRLDAMQKAVLARILEVVDTLGLVLLHEVDEVTAELAHGGQEAITRFEVEGFGIALRGMTGESPIGDDIPPIFLTGVQQEEVQIDALRQAHEEVEVDGWQR